MSVVDVSSMLIVGCAAGMLLAAVWCTRANRQELFLEAIALGLIGGFFGGFQGAFIQARLETGIFAGLLFAYVLSLAFSAALLRHLFKRR